MQVKHDNNIPVIRSDQSIPLEIHNEYIAYHDDVDLDQEKKAMNEMVSMVFDPQCAIEEKKRALFVLGHCGTLESYNALKRYCDTTDHDLTAWATLCLNECRSWLAGEILEDDSEIVMTSAGGDGNRLRFYFIVSTIRHQMITASDQDVILKNVRSIAKKSCILVESVSFGGNHAVLTMLIPVDLAPGAMIEDMIHECNDKESFLRFHYFVSNIQEPTQEDIQQYLDDLS